MTHWGNHSLFITILWLNYFKPINFGLFDALQYSILLFFMLDLHKAYSLDYLWGILEREKELDSFCAYSLSVNLGKQILFCGERI